MQMRRRRMQWSTSPIILIISLLLIPIIVHGFNEEKKDDEEESFQPKMRLELVHRSDARFAKHSGGGGGDVVVVDHLENLKGFLHRDYLRRQRMNQRWGLTHLSHRRKDYETVEMPMHSARDYGLGEYFVQVTVGTPGQKFWLVADTGNELTWFNCRYSPHKNRTRTHRHHKKRSRPRSRSRSKSKTKTRTKARTKTKPCDGVFCPKRSHSFHSVTCSSQTCKVDLSSLFSLSYCPAPSDPCLYDISYVDGSSAKGFFGTDTITVGLTDGNQEKLHDLIIGCTKSVQNGVNFNDKTDGILGLGYAKGTFVDKALLRYGGKFSYCLVDHLSHKNVSSYLTFGSYNVKLLGEMKKTELVLVPPFYGVNVVGISLNGQMLKIPPRVWDFNALGGVILDSGTTLTSLPIPAYEPVFEALNKSLSKFKSVDGIAGVLEFCFDTEGYDESVVPRLAFHFAGGASFEPPVKSYVIDASPTVKCIGLVPLNGPGTSVIGNIMQQNHLWEFDFAQYTVGFAPSTCT